MDNKTIFYSILAIAIISLIIRSVNFLKSKEKRKILQDPIYLIIMGVVIVFSIVLLFFSLLFLPVGIIIVGFTQVLIIRLSDDKYDVEKDVKNAFKIAKKCPNCIKSLPSYLTKKCPHCTADL
jgi:hypothetical protein